MTTFQRVLGYDEALLVSVRRWHAPWAVRLMRAATQLGDTKTWFLLGLTLLAVNTHETFVLGLRLGLGAIFATLLVQPLKRVCRRPRPSRGIAGFASLMEDPDAFSFPSGHTAAAFAVAIALLGTGTLLAPLALGLAGAIALSRVYLGAHYPLDVGAGALLGCLAGLAARFVLG